MAEALEAGDPAPSFDLPKDGGGTAALSAYKGRKLVLYFYPRDDTEGCTREAIAFNGHRAAFRAAGTEVLGVSADSVKSHEKFKKKYGLAFPLASDETTQMLQAYGVWTEKSMYGRTFMGVERTTFLIGPDGTILRIWRKVRVDGHVAEALAAAREA
jgi:peroxiredoxin Q/BCP